MSELTTWKKVDNPLFKFIIFDIESRGDNSTLIQTSCQLNDNLGRSVVIDNFKFPNVSCVNSVTEPTAQGRVRYNRCVSVKRPCRNSTLEANIEASGPCSSCLSRRTSARSQHFHVMPRCMFLEYG